MHLHLLLHSLAFFALTSAIALAPRSPYCDNAPTTVAGSQVPVSFFPSSFLPNPSKPNLTSSPSSLLTRHLLSPAPPPLHPRTTPPTYLWCTPLTRTHILLTLTSLLPANALPLPATLSNPNPISALLTLALTTITTHIRLHGDGPLPGGGYDWMSESADLVVWNAGNHQTTWGVLGAAVEALAECMRVNGWGRGRFGIWDGGREVGGGEVG